MRTIPSLARPAEPPIEHVASARRGGRSPRRTRGRVAIAEFFSGLFVFNTLNVAVLSVKPPKDWL